jgi:hypothetical protein
VHMPGSPAALHLQELLSLLSGRLKPVLALPAPLDAAAAAPLAATPVVFIPSANTSSARLAWEQVTLPRLAQRCGASVLHMTSASAALFSPVPVVVSPAEPVSRGSFFGSTRPRRTGDRLRAAFARGGLASARAVLWPADLPAPVFSGPRVMRLPPVAHPEMWLDSPTPAAEDSGYVVAFGPFEDTEALNGMLDAWRWAAPAMGEGWSVRAAGLPPDAAPHLESLRLAARLPGALLPAPVSGPHALAALLAGAGAVLHVGALCPWGDPLLHTLAAGRPMASEETWGVDARVGPAAYLAAAGDGRGLGAAILTLLVEESVAEQISQAARQRAAGWDHSAFSQQLEEIYRRF